MPTEKPNFFSLNQISIIDSPIEDKYIKPLSKGGKTFKYVNAPVIIDILNQAFGYAWSWTITDQGIQKTSPTNKVADPPGSYYWVKGILSVPIVDNNNSIVGYVKKESYGGQVAIGSAEVQSQAFKIAATDALKKAASMLGIAKNVYMADDVYENYIEDKANQDSWGDSELAKYKSQIDKMLEYKTKIGDEKLKKLKLEFCKKSNNYTIFGEITPSNIIDFIDYITPIIEPQQTEQSKIENDIFSTPVQKNIDKISPFGGK